MKKQIVGILLGIFLMGSVNASSPASMSIPNLSYNVFANFFVIYGAVIEQTNILLHILLYGTYPSDHPNYTNNNPIDKEYVDNNPVAKE